MIIMKKYLLKIIYLTIIFSLIISTHYSSLADDDTIDTSIKSDSNFANEFNPQNIDDDSSNLSQPFTNAIVKIVNAILAVIQTIGGLLMIVSVAIFGFYMVVMSHGPLAQDLGIGGKQGNSPDAKVGLLNFGRSLLIGSVLLFSSATLVRFVFNIFTT